MWKNIKKLGRRIQIPESALLGYDGKWCLTTKEELETIKQMMHKDLHATDPKPQEQQETIAWGTEDKTNKEGKYSDQDVRSSMRNKKTTQNYPYVFCPSSRLSTCRRS